jgi:hypothetical protein
MLDAVSQYKLDLAYQQDMRQHAENARFIQGMNGKQAPYAPVLAFLGKMLLRVGESLEKRYGEKRERAANDADYQLETV